MDGVWYKVVGEGRRGHTKHKHNIEKDNQHHGNSIDDVAGRSHPKGASGHVAASGEEVRADG